MGERSSEQVVREVWQAVADTDVEALRKLTDPDLVWRATGRARWRGDYRGRETVLGFLATVGEGVSDLRSELRDVFVRDDRAVVVFRLQASRPDGRKLDTDVVLLLGLREGRLAEVTSVPVDPYASDAFWA